MTEAEALVYAAAVVARAENGTTNALAYGYRCVRMLRTALDTSRYQPHEEMLREFLTFGQVQE